jgi:hypothetical protein
MNSAPIGADAPHEPGRIDSSWTNPDDSTEMWRLCGDCVESTWSVRARQGTIGASVSPVPWNQGRRGSWRLVRQKPLACTTQAITLSMACLSLAAPPPSALPAQGNRSCYSPPMPEASSIIPPERLPPREWSSSQGLSSWPFTLSSACSSCQSACFWVMRPSSTATSRDSFS